jgi:DNA-binding transcriptional MerR regulator
MALLLTMPEFAEAAARAVQASGAVPDNRQAKAVPAARMIRYYTARGLLPRPGTRGRALVYGRRHLLQLVAIKRLQGQGMALDEIAERLEAISDSDLEDLAAIASDAIPADLGEVDPTRPGEPSRTAGRFWEATPAGVDPVTAASEVGQLGADTSPRHGAIPSTGASARATGPVVGVNTLTEVRLSDSVRLLIEGDPSGLPSLDTLRAAASPLLHLLPPERAAHDRNES